MTQTQTQNLDQFAADVRARLANIDSGLKSLKTRADGDATQAEAEARSQLAKVSADIEANKPKLLDKVRHVIACSHCERSRG